MKFLIDECLHSSLVTVAHGKGYVCDHVNFLGLGSFKDWDLMSKIRDGEYTFVTNNGSDFTALYRREQLHAGLVILIPNVTPARQQEMFRAALIHIGNRELTNSVVEVSIAGGEITCREFDWPPSKPRG
jgi:predicted nuclease of predicted toxin-antitoxin system